MSHFVQQMIDASELEDGSENIELPVQNRNGQAVNFRSIAYWSGEQSLVSQDIVFWTGELNEVVRRDGKDDNNYLPVYRGTATEFLRKLNAHQRALNVIREKYGDEAAEDMAREHPVPSVRFDVSENSWAYKPKRFKMDGEANLKANHIDFKKMEQHVKNVNEQAVKAQNNSYWNGEQAPISQDTTFWTGQLDEIIKQDGVDGDSHLPIYRGTATEFLLKLEAHQRALDAMRQKYGDEIADNLARDYPVPSVRFDVSEHSWAYNPRRFQRDVEIISNDASDEDEEMEDEETEDVEMEREEGVKTLRTVDEDGEEKEEDLIDDEPTCYLIDQPAYDSEEEYDY